MSRIAVTEKSSQGQTPAHSRTGGTSVQDATPLPNGTCYFGVQCAAHHHPRGLPTVQLASSEDCKSRYHRTGISKPFQRPRTQLPETGLGAGRSLPQIMSMYSARLQSISTVGRLTWQQHRTDTVKKAQHLGDKTHGQISTSSRTAWST